jgi:hypothetical protein
MAPTALVAGRGAARLITPALQMDMDPGLGRDKEDREGRCADPGALRPRGTQINLNVMDKQTILEAHKDPSKYPDLWRVTASAPREPFPEFRRSWWIGS